MWKETIRPTKNGISFQRKSAIFFFFFAKNDLWTNIYVFKDHSDSNKNLSTFSDISNISSEGRQHSGVFFNVGESIEFAGMAVSHLAMDPNRMLKSGKILMTSDLAREYGFKDLDGSINDMRSISVLLKAYGYGWISQFVPSFLRIPLFLMHLGSNKFY